MSAQAISRAEQARNAPVSISSACVSGLASISGACAGAEAEAGAGARARPTSELRALDLLEPWTDLRLAVCAGLPTSLAEAEVGKVGCSAMGASATMGGVLARVVTGGAAAERVALVEGGWTYSTWSVARWPRLRAAISSAVGAETGGGSDTIGAGAGDDSEASDVGGAERLGAIGTLVLATGAWYGRSEGMSASDGAALACELERVGTTMALCGRCCRVAGR